MDRRDPFSQYHPAVCFLYFVGAILMGTVIRHPVYVGASCVLGAVYYGLLKGRALWTMLLRLLPLLVLVTVLNPLLNTRGEHVLLSLWGRSFTLEALCYGAVTAGIFALTFLWFGCYNVVLTGDKFTVLFGNLIPALSLLLVMVLGMIGDLSRRLKQILNARSGIGMGVTEQNAKGEKLRYGMTALSALTDKALEGSIIKGDSMKARGYGCGKRTAFAKRSMKPREWAMLLFVLALGIMVLAWGSFWADFSRTIRMAPLGWGFAAYCIFLSMPILLHIKEAILWHRLRSKI